MSTCASEVSCSSGTLVSDFLLSGLTTLASPKSLILAHNWLVNSMLLDDKSQFLMDNCRVACDNEDIADPVTHLVES